MLGAVAVSAAVLLPTAPAAAVSAPCGPLTVPERVADHVIPSLDQLACADLRGIDFGQEDLEGADLHGSNLQGVSLVQANLTNANLAGADLAGASLSQADLVGANLRGANLRHARLIQADLTRADLRDADLRDAELIQATMYRTDTRDADLRGATLIQVDTNPPETTEAVPTPTLTPTPTPEPTPESVRADPGEQTSAEEAVPVATGPQLAWVAFWPACALVLLWWRIRFGFLLRHRDTTRPRAGDLVAAGSGVVLVVAGLYLTVVGVGRGFAHLVSTEFIQLWDWAIDPGPLGWLATEPQWQLFSAAAAFVLGGFARLLGRRRPKRTPVRAIGQVSAGEPSPAAWGPAFSRPVRDVARFVLLAAVLDFLAVIAILIFGELPTTGPWQGGTVIAHLVFVAVLMIVAFRFASHADYGEKLHTLTGVVLVGGVREPFVWLSGKTTDDDPVSTALPWEALEQVHLIRVLGTAQDTAAMFTVRLPGSKRASEHPTELSVTPEQVDALRAMVPPEMITEHTRVPSSN
ncbi:hypothetical protein BLA60_01490 [Actinophytocola xinjiangensis]|uniref:Pentapeptide repeat protein n=1 Tax=Actinophytocola xinjiangensis TaxID=485602 RepID=A0A7Z1B188_9PSEU|nr:hypothetical protein BLA60_01490 [Actinophytocola xinjiangensis]